MLSVLLLALLWSSCIRGDSEMYCSETYAQLCHGKGTHVGCQYSQPGPGDDCKNYTKINFDDGLSNYIIDFINRHRQTIASGNELAKDDKVVPEPAVVMLVEWDDELAFLAQRLAEQCLFIHDHCRATTRYPFAGQAVGEARARSTEQQLEPRRAVPRILDAWWAERSRVTPDQLLQPFALSKSGNIWGHFTQLAAWSLRGVGCGGASHGSPAAVLLVCDFSHTNMLGQSTLTPGPEAPCPKGTARLHLTYPGLCAPIPPATIPKKSKKMKSNFEDDGSAHITRLPRLQGPPEYEIRQEYPIEYIPVYTRSSQRTTKMVLDYEVVDEGPRRRPSQEYLHNKIIVLENHVRTLLKKIPGVQKTKTDREVFNKLLRDGRKSSTCNAPPRANVDAESRREGGDPGFLGRAMQPLRPPARGGARVSNRVIDKFQMKAWKTSIDMQPTPTSRSLAPFAMNYKDAKQLFLDTGFNIQTIANLTSY